MSRVAASGFSHPHSDFLLWGGVKEFADGSLGSSTALFWEPYLDASPANSSTLTTEDTNASVTSAAAASGTCENTNACSAGAVTSSSSSSGHDGCSGHSCGTRTIPTAELAVLVRRAAGAGLQVAVHAIGDRAVDEVLDVYGDVLGASSGGNIHTPPTSQVEHRIEHVQHILSANTAAKMGSLGVVGVPNPQHLLTDQPLLLPKLGQQRSGPGRAFAYKTLKDAGVSLGFGSDWPVVEVDPWMSAYAAAFRRSPPGSSDKGEGDPLTDGSSTDKSVVMLEKSERVWEDEEECLDLNDVLLGHTLRAAQVARLDHWVGKLSPGYKADFLVLDKSPFPQASHDDSSTGDRGTLGSQGRIRSGLQAGLPKVERTYLGGLCVFGCVSIST